ncbi:hypothetical protein DVH24_002127 [Malus domestica]|uniref:Uncharacterized protein n=1 Tax=Malus domestica TaxID=3750 RepID=A0A498I6U8_MALDO|nr:hypothetical protein DVH24_002127 [Malus domestica]
MEIGVGAMTHLQARVGFRDDAMDIVVWFSWREGAAGLRLEARLSHAGCKPGDRRKDLGPSRVIHFTSEREFVQLLHEGHPVVVAFTLRCNLTKHLDGVLEEAAAEFYPHLLAFSAAKENPDYSLPRRNYDAR